MHHFNFINNALIAEHLFHHIFVIEFCAISGDQVERHFAHRSNPRADPRVSYAQPTRI